MKLSIALILLAFGTLAFGWVTGQDVILYASIAFSAVAGVALLKSTLGERKSGRSKQRSNDAAGQRPKRGRGRRFGRKKGNAAAPPDAATFEPISTVRTVRDPVAIARAQWPEQAAGTSVEGTGGSIVDFRSRLAAALDESSEQEDDESSDQPRDLWADLEPDEMEPFDFEDRREPDLRDLDTEDDSEAEEEEDDDQAMHTMPVDVVEFDDEESGPLVVGEASEDTAGALDDASVDEERDELLDEEYDVPSSEVVAAPALERLRTPVHWDDDDEDDDVPIEWVPIDDLPQILKAQRAGKRGAPSAPTGRTGRAKAGGRSAEDKTKAKGPGGAKAGTRKAGTGGSKTTQGRREATVKGEGRSTAKRTPAQPAKRGGTGRGAKGSQAASAKRTASKAESSAESSERPVNRRSPTAARARLLSTPSEENPPNPEA